MKSAPFIQTNKTSIKTTLKWAPSLRHTITRREEKKQKTKLHIERTSATYKPKPNHEVRPTNPNWKPVSLFSNVIFIFNKKLQWFFFSISYFSALFITYIRLGAELTFRYQPIFHVYVHSRSFGFLWLWEDSSGNNGNILNNFFKKKCKQKTEGCKILKVTFYTEISLFFSICWLGALGVGFWINYLFFFFLEKIIFYTIF